MEQINENFLPVLERIARTAGAAILEIYGGHVATWTKSDASPVTEADIRADEIICAELKRLFPGTMIVTEEGDMGFFGTKADEFFLVDPLDGTKEFLSRNGEFTVNIALIRQGRAVAGVVYAPAVGAEGAMYLAASGLGAWRHDASGKTSLFCAPRQPGMPIRVIGSRSHSGTEMADWLNNLDEDYTFVPAGSSLKFCRIAEGKADIYPRLGPTSQWDTAAGQCIIETAGGSVRTFDGGPLLYGLNRTILNPDFVARGCF